jgi:lipoyl(octanoyl) transferase
MLTFEDWGLIDYHTAWQRQRELQSAVQRGERDSTLVFCQHPTVITIGKEGGWHNIRLSALELAERGVEVVEINRGGDVTLHALGQLVGYPIIRLTDFKPDLHWFLRELEQCIIETIAAFGVEGRRCAGYTGVWIDPDTPQARKICAIGIHCSRWVTAHGFALNVANDVRDFAAIIPCGLDNTNVASLWSVLSELSELSELSGKNQVHNLPDIERVQAVCREVFFAHFT